IKDTMNPRTTVSKEIELDAGHRVPDHGSKCRSPHGHRYRVRATCEGDVIDEIGAEDSGMVIDFSLLKSWLHEQVHQPLDHAFILHEKDVTLIAALAQGASDDGADWNIVAFPYIPTAENIARWCWEQLAPLVKNYWRNAMTLS